MKCGIENRTRPPQQGLRRVGIRHCCCVQELAFAARLELWRERLWWLVCALQPFSQRDVRGSGQIGNPLIVSGMLN